MVKTSQPLFPAPKDISSLVYGEDFASAAFELDDQTRWAESFNPISALFVSSFRIFSVFFVVAFFLTLPTCASNPAQTPKTSILRSVFEHTMLKDWV